MVVVSSTDGFCSVIKFTPDEIGTVYNDEDADLADYVWDDLDLCEYTFYSNVGSSMADVMKAIALAGGGMLKPCKV